MYVVKHYAVFYGDMEELIDSEEQKCPSFFVNRIDWAHFFHLKTS